MYDFILNNKYRYQISIIVNKDLYQCFFIDDDRNGKHV